MKLESVTGEITQVGQYTIDKLGQEFAHVEFMTEDGLVRVSNLIVDTGITPRIVVGNKLTMDFIHKKALFGKTKNAALAVVTASGVVLAIAPSNAAMALLFALFIGSILFMLIAGIASVLFFGPLAFLFFMGFRSNYKASAWIDTVRNKYQSTMAENRVVKAY